MPYGKGPSAGSSEGLSLAGLSLLPVILPGAFYFPWLTPGKGLTAGQPPPHRRELKSSISLGRVFPLLSCPIPGCITQPWGMIPFCTQDPTLDVGSHPMGPLQSITWGAGTGAAPAVMNTQETHNKHLSFPFLFLKYCDFKDALLILGIN